MRAFKRYNMRGFTLVELMIVVAIIGVLAALAIYGVTRYLASAKTSEAKNTIGAIARGAQGAFEREQQAAEMLPDGDTGTQLSHNLCGSSSYSIAGIPAGRKDQPAASTFETTDVGNSANVGWKCLRFSITDPTYYRYAYSAVRIAPTDLPSGESAATPSIPAGLSLPTGGDGQFLAFAEGDLDSDGIIAGFGVPGEANKAAHTVKIATQLQIQDELE
jgi:type IV pilus assembly protein PilA